MRLQYQPVTKQVLQAARHLQPADTSYEAARQQLMTPNNQRKGTNSRSRTA